MQQLLHPQAEHLHRLRQSLELHLPQRQGQAAETRVDQVVGGAHEGHAIGRTHCLQARSQMNALAEDVVAIGIDLAGVQPEAMGERLPAPG